MLRFEFLQNLLLHQLTVMVVGSPHLLESLKEWATTLTEGVSEDGVATGYLRFVLEVGQPAFHLLGLGEDGLFEGEGVDLHYEKQYKESVL